MTKFIVEAQNQGDIDFYQRLFKSMKCVYEVYNTEEEEKNYKDLKQSLEEVVAYEKGDLKLMTLEEMIEKL